MNRDVEARFQRIERNLELTAAINAETARLAKQNEQAIKEVALLAKGNEQAMKRVLGLFEVFIRGQGRSNGRSK